MDENKSVCGWRSVTSNLWSLWAFMTIGTAATIYGGGERAHWSYYPYAFFNLFTPILLGNLKPSMLILTLPLLVGGLYMGNLLGKRIPYFLLRLAYNLLMLFLLTLSVDLITWRIPISMNMALERIWNVQQIGITKDFQKIFASDPKLFQFNNLELGKSSFVEAETQFGKGTLQPGFVHDGRYGICYEGAKGFRLYLAYMPLLSNDPQVVHQAIVTDQMSDAFGTAHCEASSMVDDSITIAHLHLNMLENEVQAFWGKPQRVLSDNMWFYQFLNQFDRPLAVLVIKFRNHKVTSFDVNRDTL